MMLRWRKWDVMSLRNVREGGLIVVELPNFSRLCISYFLLCNQYPQNSATCDDNLLSHSLCGPWIREQLSWVVLVQGFPQGCNRDISEACSHMKTWGFYSKTSHTRGCGQEVLVSHHRGLSRGCFMILTAWPWIPSKEQSRREWEKGGCNIFYGPFSEGTYHPFHFFLFFRSESVSPAYNQGREFISTSWW